jgi:succinate dehydrogenase hydrophobic anchor subunit
MLKQPAAVQQAASQKVTQIENKIWFILFVVSLFSHCQCSCNTGKEKQYKNHKKNTCVS